MCDKDNNSNNSNNKPEDVFLKVGLKKTQGRNAVLNVLMESDKPLTYDEVFMALIDKNASLNISTVYRILEKFSDKGITTKLKGGENNRSLYELSRNGHRHYFFCVTCKEISPLSICPLGNLIDDLKSQHFEVFEHKLELTGVCSGCKI